MSIKFTAGDLRRQLAGMNDDTEISFPGGLTFYRFKRWSDNEFILEFSEPEVPLTPQFRERYPGILVSFCKPESFDEE